MVSEDNVVLEKLSNSNLVLTEEAEDIRGRDVIDRNDEKIGHVKDLLVDTEHNKVRFLEVGAGGFLGIGEKTFMLPIDAISKLDDKTVHIDQALEHVIDAPSYDPEMVADQRRHRGYFDDVYNHYGYPPFWTAGYTYPAYPFYV